MAYDQTRVTVASARESIAKVLEKWGARGVMWEDDFTSFRSTLRFRWIHEGSELCARLNLTIDRGGIGRTGTAKREKEVERRRRQIHRVAFYWIKSQNEAVEAGLFRPEVAILPWLEDATGKTLAETIVPRLGSLESADFGARLMIGSG